MFSDESAQNSEDKKMSVEEREEANKQPLQFLPFEVQLQNIFAIEIKAERFPVMIPSTLSAQSQLSLDEVLIDGQNFQAQVILNVHIGFIDEPHPFDISFKLVGHFSYTREVSSEMVRQYLQQGSLSVILPFARELLFSLCTRLQVPALILQMVQVAPTPMIETKNKDTSE